MPTEQAEIITPDAAEAALREAMTTPAPEATDTQDQSGSNPQQTAETTVKAEGETKTESSDTLATAETKIQPEGEKKTTEKLNPNGNKPSPFSVNGQRLEKKWTAVIAKDAELQAKEKTLAQSEQELTKREQTIVEKQALSKSRVTPEQHEEAAKQKMSLASTLSEQAEAWEAKVKVLEGEGNYTESAKADLKAKDYRKQANQAEAMADLYKQNAEHLRKNPDQTVQQITARKQQELQHYTVEAAKLWPDLGVKDSEFQNKVVSGIKTLRQHGIDENEYPALRYFIAQSVADNLAAASVPTLKKGLETAQARVKELEKLTAPEGGKPAVQSIETAPTDFSKMTLPQQEAWLRKNSK